MIVDSHAVRRFQERVRPDLGFAAAKRELVALVECARPCRKPSWVRGTAESVRPAVRQQTRWLAIGKGVVAVAHARRDGTLEVRTVLTKAERRAAAAAARRQRDHIRAQKFSKGHKRPVRS